MKKFIFAAFALMIQPAFANYYNDKAREQIVREEIKEREIKIQARAEELRRQDAESIAFLIESIGNMFFYLGKGLVYTVKGAARSIYKPSKIAKGWKNGDGEIIAGSLALGASAAGLIMYSINKLKD